MKLAALMSAVAVLGLGSAHASNLTGTLSFDGQGQQYFNYGAIPSDAISISDPDYISLTSSEFVNQGANKDTWSEYGNYVSNLNQTVYGSADEGVMGVSSKAIITGQFTSVVEATQTVLNDSGTAQTYQLNFNIGQAKLTLGGWTSDHTPRNSSASFIADIKVNGASVWQSRYELSFNNGIYPVLTQSGHALGPANFIVEGGPVPDYLYPNAVDTDGSIYFMNAEGIANLGTFAAGANFDVSYTLTAQSTFLDPEGCHGECGYATAYIDEVFALGADGFNITAVSAVPEPATYALTLLGLSAIGLITRRRQALAA